MIITRLNMYNVNRYPWLHGFRREKANTYAHTKTKHLLDACTPSYTFQFMKEVMTLLVF